ncbi:germin-like protein 9-3 [Olea europaea var. sylvestris]|uniref:germin-like protein 9-3 n=1 Tax=Olea europaea var. sylvestris TaxID=158386 RepID=UPI000C1CF1A3|nr:germin-like protein 9-3 [Olea europaea var. sylvestris]
MASFLVTKHFLLGFLVIIATSWIVQASDPDILSNLIVPPNVTAPDGNVFTFTDLRGVLDSIPPDFKVTKASKAEFSDLGGQSVSMAVLQFPAGGVNPPHRHPRAAELLFVVEGSLEVGFVDTTNKLFTQTHQTADIFVFPKGLAHYQYNSDPKEPAIAVSAFGSASSGTASLPTTLFATGVDETILAESCKTDVITIQKLKAGLAPKA